RKEESERRLAQTVENLLRVGDKIAELELSLEPLREQAAVARRFLLLRDELRGIEVSLFAYRMGQLQQLSEKSSADIESARALFRATQAESDRVYRDMEALGEVGQLREAEAERLRENISELERNAGEYREKIAALISRIEANNRRAQSINEELTNRRGRDDAVETQIRQRQERIARLAREREETTARAALLEHDMAELISRAETGQRAYLELIEREKSVAYALADRRATRAGLGQSAQELVDREDELSAEIMRLGEELSAARQDLKAASDALAAAREERESLDNVRRGLELKMTSRREKLREAEEARAKIARDLDAARGRSKLLSDMEKEYEGYSGAVRFVAAEASKRALRGIHGTVGSLVRTDEKYAVAIETALGAAVQNIVVTSEEDGRAAIETLKRRGAGRATFLPMSSIRGSVLEDIERLKSEAGFIGAAIDLARFDKRYEGIYRSLIGRAAVVDTLETAIRVSRKYGARFKLVTLDGQVMNAGGSMTGGSAAKGSGILSRAAELEKLKAKTAEFAEELRSAEETSAAAKRESQSADFQLEALKAEIMEKDGEVIRRDSALEGIMRQASEREAALETAKLALEAQRDKTAKNDRLMRELAEELARLEASEDSTRRELGAHGRAQTEASERQEKLTDEIALLRAKIGACSAEGESEEKALGELVDIRRDLLGQRERQIETARSITAENGKLAEETSENESALAALSETIASMRARDGELVAARLETEAKRASLERLTREKAQDTVRFEREISRLEQIKNVYELEEKQIIDKLWDSYELTRGNAQELALPLEDFDASKKRASALRSEISAMGSPNVGAIEEFSRVNERYEFLASQRDDVEKAGRELRGIIAEITENMREIFLRELSVIEQSFKETFAELFGGGEASLILEDPEDVLSSGIEIAVQPPGKSLRTLTLLSGGERAFVAIALYFAILKVRPAPFVVLDEIEAALDDANVLRFARYMRKMSAKTQLVVISHRRGTMEEADLLIGVTMTEKGVSRLLTVDLEEAKLIVKDGES
ncbi:MAG: chromosome segregation protein SMC, partial [Oscillospiraceae bacterium]|nr:chromosome segregation protein SMC [Oscillospiraceae bacterium]